MRRPTPFLVAPILLLAGLLLADVATAQPHPNGYAGTSTGGQVFLLSGSNTLTTVTAGTSTGHGCVMDNLNTLLMVTNLDGSLYRVDPATSTNVGSFATGLGSIYDIAVDHNGDYFVVTSTGTLFKVDQFATVTTVATAVGASTNGGMRLDIDTGELLIQSSTGTDPLLLVSRNGSSITTLGSGQDARNGIAQDIRTGDVFIGSCCGDFTPSENIFVLTKGQTAASVWLATASAPVGVYSLQADRSSAAAPRLILGAFRPSSTARGPGGFYTVDLGTKALGHVTTINASLYETEVLYHRNVHSLATGRGQWQVGIRIPEDAGAGYALAVTASGVRPGIKLPDGRRVNLVPDQVFITGFASGYGPFLTNTRGTLNTQGRAVAILNLAALGKVANGIRLHFAAVTLDVKAPLGIRTITDPHVVVVEGL